MGDNKKQQNIYSSIKSGNDSLGAKPEVFGDLLDSQMTNFGMSKKNPAQMQSIHNNKMQ